MSLGWRARDALDRALPMPAPPQEADELLHDPWFADRLSRAAAQEGRPVDQVRAEAAEYLREMAASHGAFTTKNWSRAGDWFLRAYDVLVDEEQIAKLKKLDRTNSLALAFSHRSYLDGVAVPNVLRARRFSPTFTFGGANLDLPVLGQIVARSGMVFIRRSTGNLPIYRLTLKSYVRQLVKNHRNLAWSIEGGRTRTGKLRPPVHGILKYIVNAVEGADQIDAQVVPVSIVYDQLHEVAGMTAEATGGRKKPESLGFVVRFAAVQRARMGRAYLTIGEPFPLRKRLEALHADGLTTSQAIERIALDISHRLNRATPVTVTAIVCLALLGEDRALNLDEVLETVHPLASYIEARKWPVAGAANLRDRSTVRRALQDLVMGGVLTGYDRGTEPVWRISPDQHLVAAFYRNTVIHILVDRAILELAMLTVSELDPETKLPEGGQLQVGWEEAKRLRDLLKFEFFFPGRDQFEQDLRAELRITAGEEIDRIDPDAAARLLASARPHVAHLVLRPFLDAYLVLADRLAAQGDAAVDEDDLLQETLAVGQQWALQRRIASAESVSLELYKTALALARHRHLLEAGDDVAARRETFAAEIADSVRRVALIGELAGRRVGATPPAFADRSELRR
ncbi:putative acyltransferase plsB1 [Flexivirga endophytica]|uniref:Acyltransferase plsB1 n=1 Tax=Flexivirga endophytica TaxID=1849103 RepID=A0A916WMM7_9MICO|nr:lysophospholipid acyltransferase [Flexivirga endophytica]GGB16725.1 putative acyltransferase plsB1 [Flexivirga endophytica]GHB38815.1 putative acyltransferase plsB1 [Flexivirga endophytica]